MTDAEPINYSATPARLRNGVLLGVLWGLLAVQTALFTLSYYRPARTAPAIPVAGSATAFNRVGVLNGTWIVERADPARPGPIQAPMSGRPLPGIRYVVKPFAGQPWSIRVHAIWTILPTLLAALWQTRKRYRSR